MEEKYKLRKIPKEILYVMYYEGKPLHLVPVDRTNDSAGVRPMKKVYWAEKDIKLAARYLPPALDRSKVEFMPFYPRKKERIRLIDAL